MLREAVEKIAGQPVRLHLGCGHQKFESYINVDGEYMSYDNDIVIHDISKPFPLDDNTVDEILTVHVIEHFSREVPPAMFKEFYRIFFELKCKI